jgi:hypothetical protein
MDRNDYNSVRGGVFEESQEFLLDNTEKGTIESMISQFRRIFQTPLTWTLERFLILTLFMLSVVSRQPVAFQVFEPIQQGIFPCNASVQPEI